MAKRDFEGNILTSPEALKSLYIETYANRLKHREIKSEFADIFHLKTQLWNTRMELLSHKHTPEWNLKQLEQVLSNLKNNKSMDPNSMINKIFKQGCIGTDLKLALLNLFTGIKSGQSLPSFMMLSNITSIYKNKGSRLDIDNDRGIFIQTVLKKILDKLIYNENFKFIDQNMSDSNIGARMNRNIRDHLFVLYAIINSVVKGVEGCIDIQIYDIEKAFDALWLDDSLNDLYDVLPSHKRINVGEATYLKTNEGPKVCWGVKMLSIK